MTLSVIPGGGQPSFRRGEQVAGAPDSKRAGMRGWVVAIDPFHEGDTDMYLVQFYPADSDVETHLGRELVSLERPALQLLRKEAS